jgi:curli biogenesis system outer membrane secretion channel CsgG
MKKFASFLLSLTLLSTYQPLQAAPLAGPQKRVTVMDLKDKSGGSTPWWTHVGSGMADMISTSLIKSGKCVVLEREELTVVQHEQQLGADGTLLPSTMPSKGKITGASLVLTGSVTEFGVQHQDVNVGSLSRVLPFGGNAGIERETARCVLDLRFVDTTTGHVIAATQAVGEASAHHVTEDVDSLPSVKFGTERFDQTLIGKATRQAVDKAVALIEKNLAAVPWYGRVVKAEDGKIFVNTGIEDMRTVGNEFDVVRQGEAMMDPDTGEALGSEKTTVGRIRLVSILGPRLAQAIALDQALPQTGDVIQ